MRVYGFMVLLCCVASSVGASTAKEEIRPGQTLEAELGDLDGDPSVSFALVGFDAGTLTITADALELDTRMRVFRINADGTSEPIREDDDGGRGTNSLIELDADADARYAIQVTHSTARPRSRGFSLSVRKGSAPALDRETIFADDMAYWDDVEDLARATDTAWLLVRAWVGRGKTEMDRGGYDEARAWFEQALELTSDLDPPDPIARALVLGELAWLHDEVAEYHRSIERNEEALGLFETQLGPDDPEVATTLINMAKSYWELGSPETALPLIQRSLEIREARLGPDHVLTMHSVNALGLLNKDIGLLSRARQLFERSLRTRQKYFPEESEEVAIALDNLAGILSDMGELAQARAYTARSVAAFRAVFGDNHFHVGIATANLAGILEELGLHEEALELFRKSVALAESNFDPDHVDLAIRLYDVGRALGNLGRIDEALTYLNRSLALFERKYSKHWRKGLVLHTIAILQRRSGQPEKALPAIDSAINVMRKQLGDQSQYVPRSIGVKAVVYQDLGRLDEARLLIEEAMRLIEAIKGSGHMDIAAQERNLAIVLGSLGRVPEAFGHALRSEEIRRENVRLVVRGVAERHALSFADARGSAFGCVMAIAASHHSEEITRAAWDSVIRARSLVLDEMAARRRSAARSANAELAGLWQELSSARERLATLAVRGLGGQDPEVIQERIRGTAAEKERLEAALALRSEGFRRDQQTAEAGLSSVEASLPVESGIVSYVRYRPPDRWEWARVPGQSEQNDAGDLYLAFVLAQGGGLPKVIPLGRASDIDGLVQAWRNELEPRSARDFEEAAAESTYRTAGAALRAAIWDPVERFFGETKRVFIVADGALNNVNFGALPMATAGYLIENGLLLHYLSTERDLVVYANESATGAGLLALGGPDYDETALFAAMRGGSGPTEAQEMGRIADEPAQLTARRSSCREFQASVFEPLPFAIEEARSISSKWTRGARILAASALGAALCVVMLVQVYRLRTRLSVAVRVGAVIAATACGAAIGFAFGSTFSQSSLMIGSRATELAFKEGAAGHQILHLATHGFFLEDECGTQGQTRENPLLHSGLVLAGANHREAAALGEEDGILTAEEIAALDLEGVQWAVLSACDAGLGEVRNGEGVLGLRRAFQIAGARTVVMSLWSIDDRSTRDWMGALYDARLNGSDTPSAVRSASLQLLAQRREAGLSTHPFYWAGLIAAGDWR